MGYNELIKNYSKVRNYMREFYVDGFHHRSDLPGNKKRTFGDTTRRVLSWLGDDMHFKKDACGKRVYISVDSRNIRHNPLYNAFKTCTFVDNDIMLHFFIMDIMKDYPQGIKLSELEDLIYDKQGKYDPEHIESIKDFDQGTIRKRLKEYEKLGMIRSRKEGSAKLYELVESSLDLNAWKKAAAFYSETAPLGVIGSFILDKFTSAEIPIQFKHHYILHAIDSEILYELLDAITEKKQVTLTITGKKKKIDTFPLKIYISNQDGREYLLGYSEEEDRFYFTRLEHIDKVALGEKKEMTAVLLTKIEAFQKHTWGKSTKFNQEPEFVSMTLKIGPDEAYIIRRLEREKRCGSIEDLGADQWRFYAEVYDAYELLPWIKTFTGRIIKLESSNEKLLKTFYEDLQKMDDLYGGENDALS